MSNPRLSKIIWLASYPRSGNTWTRMFLAHLLSNSDKTADINLLPRGLSDWSLSASKRELFDQFAGIDSSELPADEIDRLRPRVYEAVAAAADKDIFLKIHDAYLSTIDGEPMIPPSVTRAVIYIVRNPLDVAVSLAFYQAIDFDTAIKNMGSYDYSLADKPGRLSTQVRQRILNWSGHVASWIDAPSLKCHTTRYEDMVSYPDQAFGAAVHFLGLPYADAAIKCSIEKVRFEALQEQEELRGFLEKPAQTARFFREGKIGAWRKYLNAVQVGKIIEDHHEMMTRIGYLGSDDSPVF